MREIIYDNEAREQLLAGINKLAKAVTVTLGPQGKNVLINLDASSVSHITKDGVTVANSIELKDPIENLGAMLLKEVAKKTVKEAGDGTTTSIVLAQAMIESCLKSIPDTLRKSDVKDGMLLAVKLVVEFLKKHSIQINNIEDLINIATISANNDEEVGKLIGSLGINMLKNGAVTIEPSNTSDSYTKVIEGLQLNSGYVSSYFSNTENGEVIFDNPQILLFEKRVPSIKELTNILQNCLSNNTPLVIIGESIDDDTLGTLVINKMNAGLKVVVIKTPGFGGQRLEMLEDISLLTSSTIVSESLGISTKTPNILGTCTKIIIDKDSTIIMSNSEKSESTISKIESITAHLKEPNLDIAIKTSLENRLTRLSGGVGIIYVGGNSEVEIKEKIDRYEDALCAVKAALEEGVIPGGSSMYIRATNNILENSTTLDVGKYAGLTIVLDAIQKPFEMLLTNAGYKDNISLNTRKLLDTEIPMGFNFKEGKIENLLESGVIDPTKVARVALENAASIAIMLLTIECIVVNNQENSLINTLQ